ncbi:MAG: DUF2178 domain-containing protein [Candidatus Hodarchaeota archaeon]
MNEKFRFYAIAIAFSLVVLALVVLGYTYFEDEEIVQAPLLVIIAIIVSIAGLIFLKKRYNDLKTDQPRVDERTQKVKAEAGYYAYLISLYMWLAIMFVNSARDTTPIAMGIVGMALLFFASWLYLNWKEKR